MSKPDPTITANLLSSVLGKTEFHQEGAVKLASKVAHPETHEGPAPKTAKPKNAKHTAAGQGRMRSSNRGK